MLIMNQNRDALVDTTGAIIRIDEIIDKIDGEKQPNRYRVCGYVCGMRVTISEHVDLEEAEKAVMLIHMANAVGMDSWDFNGDMSKLDDAIKGLKSVAIKRQLGFFRGE